MTHIHVNGTKPIPTDYGGGHYRSRLEARWAAFFDLIGLPYIYEPSDHGGYIPDFLIPGKNPLYVEVGPVTSLDEYYAKARKPLLALPDNDFIVLGTDPLCRGIAATTGGGEVPVIGIHYQRNGPEALKEDWGCEATISRGYECGHISIVNMVQSFTKYPCGHYEGGDWGDPVEPERVERLWREAGSLSQWKAPRA